MQTNNSHLMLYMHICPIYNFRDPGVRLTPGQFRWAFPLIYNYLGLRQSCSKVCRHYAGEMIFVSPLAACVDVSQYLRMKTSCSSGRNVERCSRSQCRSSLSNLTVHYRDSSLIVLLKDNLNMRPNQTLNQYADSKLRQIER